MLLQELVGLHAARPGHQPERSFGQAVGAAGLEKQVDVVRAYGLFGSSQEGEPNELSFKLTEVVRI